MSFRVTHAADSFVTTPFSLFGSARNAFTALSATVENQSSRRVSVARSSTTSSLVARGPTVVGISAEPVPTLSSVPGGGATRRVPFIRACLTSTLAAWSPPFRTRYFDRVCASRSIVSSPFSIL